MPDHLDRKSNNQSYAFHCFQNPLFSTYYQLSSLFLNFPTSWQQRMNMVKLSSIVQFISGIGNSSIHRGPIPTSGI